MDDPEPIIEGCMPKVDDRPLSSLARAELGLKMDADDGGDGVGSNDAVRVAAFSNYIGE